MTARTSDREEMRRRQRDDGRGLEGGEKARGWPLASSWLSALAGRGGLPSCRHGACTSLHHACAFWSGLTNAGCVRTTRCRYSVYAPPPRASSRFVVANSLDDPRWLASNDATLSNPRGWLPQLHSDRRLTPTTALSWNLHYFLVAASFWGIKANLYSSSSSSSRCGRPRFRPAACGAGASPAGTTPLVAPATSNVRLIFFSSSSGSWSSLPYIVLMRSANPSLPTSTLPRGPTM